MFYMLYSTQMRIFVGVMMEKTRGLVLHSIRYGESSMIVHIFTQSRGTVSFVVRVPRSRKSALRAVLLRPLTLLEFDYDHRSGRQLQQLSDVRLALPYQSIPYEPMKSAMALYLSEFLYYALRNEGENPPLFDYLCHALEWFDQADEGYTNFHMALLIHITRFLGIWPSTDGYHEGGLFDIQEGRFVASVPRSNIFLSAQESAMIDIYLRMDYRNMKRFHLNRHLRQRVLDLITAYYQAHVPGFPEVKSLAILREVLS